MTNCRGDRVLLVALLLVAGGCGSPMRSTSQGDGGHAGSGNGGHAGSGNGGHAGSNGGGHAGSDDGGQAGSYVAGDAGTDLGHPGDAGADVGAKPDAPTDRVADASVELPPSAGKGAACRSSGECQAGLSCSRDGVCCDTACAGACMACKHDSTGGVDGTCAPVLSGQDPADDCAAAQPESCGNDGTCDGAGACRKFGGSQPCAAGMCNGSTFTPAASCNGLGRCVANGANQQCGSFPCSPTTGCATACAVDGDCLTGSYCAGTTCTVKKNDGQTCAGARECLNGSCVDNVCCESACGGTCMSCSQTPGRCLPATAGTDPRDQCAAGTTTCGQDGACNGAGACRFVARGTTCGTTSCTAGQLTPTGSCDGAGTCAPAAAQACPGSLVCASATACKTSCQVDGDCTGGLRCASGTCAAQTANGQTCAANAECASGFCVDGVCCNTACTASCQACDNALSVGTCSRVVLGAPHGARACAGTGTPCVGTCTGRADGACTYPIGACGSGPTCVDSTTLIGQSMCNAGACVTPGPQTCAGGVLCAAGACKTTCSVDADCAPTHFCHPATRACIPRAVKLAAEYGHACVIVSDGTVRCWGGNINGQLGNGTFALPPSPGDAFPVTVKGLPAPATAIALGSETSCAVLGDGSIWCWGKNNFGQLGTGSLVLTSSATPVQVTGISTATAALAAGEDHYCDIVADGSVWCWGSNEFGQLGNGTQSVVAGVPTPGPVQALASLAGGQIAASTRNTYALFPNGVLQSWGDNTFGQLGIGTVTGTQVTVPVTASFAAQSISGGDAQACAILDTGSPACWGSDSTGELGEGGSGNPSGSPLTVLGLAGVLTVAAGTHHGCALVAGGGVGCWGRNDFGQCGQGMTSAQPVAPNYVTSVATVTAVAPGDDFTCVLRSNGSVVCWGAGFAGQIGNNTFPNAQLTPAQVNAW